MRALAEFKPPAAASECWPDFDETIGLLRRNAVGWPGELDAVVPLVRAASRAHARGRVGARRRDLAQLAQIAATYPSRERFLTELTLDPPGATSDQSGPPLLDEDYLILSTIHSAKGQEWTSVYVLEHRRRLPAVRPVDRLDAGNRGRAAAALRRDDAGARPVASDGAAALLHPRPARKRRPPRLCAAHPLHSEFNAEAFRPPLMAAAARGASRRAAARRSMSAPACGICVARRGAPLVRSARFFVERSTSYAACASLPLKVRAPACRPRR